MADIGGHAAERLAIFQKLLDALKQEIDVLDADGRPCYTDVCEWFAGLLGTDASRQAYCDGLRSLCTTCLAITGIQANRPQATVPELVGAASLEPCAERYSLRLWQLAVHERSHVKGAPPLHSVRDCMQKFVSGYGNETGKYPLEVLFQWGAPHVKAGDLLVDAQIPDLSIAVSVGSSVTILDSDEAGHHGVRGPPARCEGEPGPQALAVLM